MNDPFYGLFVKEMTRCEHEENLQKSVLTKEESKKKRKIALEIVKKLRSKRDEDLANHKS
jgi:hypothetical protein